MCTHLHLYIDMLMNQRTSDLKIATRMSSSSYIILLLTVLVRSFTDWSMSSEESKFLSSRDSTSLAIFTSLQILIGTTANICVIIYFLVFRHSAQRTASDKLTLNLAISDFFALTTYLPWRTYLLILRESTEHKNIYASLFVVCIFATGNAILVIALDRLTAVVWPLRYKTLITSNVSSTFIAISWISAIVFGVVHGFSYKVHLHDPEYELFLCSMSFVQLALLSVIYGILLRTARKQRRYISNMRGSLQAGFFLVRKSILTSFTIMILFYATFLPYSIYRVYSTIEENLTDHEKNTAWRWLTAFTFINSCCNPFVYFFGMRRHRTMLTKYFQAWFGSYRKRKHGYSPKVVNNSNDMEDQV